MYKICQTEQSYKRQRELEKGLLQMMLSKNYEEISISDLCEFMQIPRKSFYRYFSSKDGALYALIDHTLADFFQMPVPDKKSRGSAIGDLDLYFAFWYENKTFLDALQDSSLSGILVERATNFSLKEGLLPRKFKGFRPEIQSLVMAFSICGLMSMVLQWHRQGFQISPADMTNLAINMLTTPLLNP
ncbi:MAG: TetR/AcrR family transcriptional regulator [Oscillospiraceae bacterium]|nr:TetR/AcrR family transcriptional regulator [Oscillospiraceae bacterium]